MDKKTQIIAVAGKGGVGKTSLAGVIVKLLVEAYPDKKILAIDADPAVGLSTVLNVEVEKTIDDIRKEVIKNVEDGDTKTAVELLGEAKYEIMDAVVEQDGYAFIAIGRPETAGCYCKINSYLKEVITMLSDKFDSVIHHKLICNFLDCLHNLASLLARVSNKQQMCNLLHNSSVNLLYSCFSINYNIIELI